MQNKLAILLVSVILAGCAHDGPVINTLIQKVEIPIAVPCGVDEPAIPVFNFDNLTVDDPLFDKTKALLADRKLHIAYEAELLAALKACKQPAEQVK